MKEVRLGIDVACRADHRASLADKRGEFIWSSWRFRTTTADLERLWAKIPEDASVTVILEPTRNAWVPLSAWLQARGATVILVPPGRRPICGITTTSTPRPTDWIHGCWLVCRCCTPRACEASTTSARRGHCAEPCVTAPAWSSAAPPPACASMHSSSCSVRVGQFARIGHRVEDRPGRFGEIRRSTGAQASRARPAGRVVGPLECGTVAPGQGRRALGHGERDPGPVVRRGHRLQRVGPRHRLRSPGAPPPRRRDRRRRQADRRPL